MATATATRRLAAILAADVVGYSRLMGADEEGTHERFKAHLVELVDPKIREHHGRIVKTTGDGVLAEFASVVDAVRCAGEIQRGMANRDLDLAEERRLRFRIGVNLGDVIADGGDIYGDGVNIAARLEALAEPGGLCISRTVRDHIGDRLPYSFDDLGEQNVKNIAQPVHAYELSAASVRSLPEVATPSRLIGPSRRNRSRLAILMAGIVAAIGIGTAVWWVWPKGNSLPVPGQASVAASAQRPPAAEAKSVPRLSIVVLPFSNLSNDPDQEYFADGVTDDLTTDLSRISGSFVIARTTAFTYKGKPIDVKQIGHDLGVRYVLEGSAQPSDSKVRVTAQFIDAETGAHLWADQFDADRSNLLEMQDEIVVRLSRALLFQYVAVDIARVNRTRPGNLDAEDLAIRCIADLIAGPAGWATAPGLCDRALQIDPRNVLALSLSAEMIIIPVILAQSDDPIAATRRADELASRALAIDPNFDYAHVVKAWILMAQNRHEEAIVEGERGLALN